MGLKFNPVTGELDLVGSSSGGGGLSNVVDDTTPQLGGDLDTNSHKIQGITTQTATSSGIHVANTGSGVVTTNSTLDAATTLTVMGWFKLDGASLQYGMLFTKYVDDNNHKFQVFRNSFGSTLYVRVGNGGSTLLTGTMAVFDGAWHHVALTMDNTNVVLYVDGQVDVSAPWTTVYTGGGDINFMSRSSYATTGYGDELRWYSTAFNQTQVQAEYAAGVGRQGSSSDANLVFGFHLDEGTGTTAYDYSSHGYTMALTNATWTSGKVLTPVSIGHTLSLASFGNGVASDEQGIITVGDVNGTTNVVGKSVAVKVNGNNSLSFDDVGHVGVGTTNPIAGMHVAVASDTIQVLAKGNSGQTNSVIEQQDSGGSKALYSDVAGNFFRNAGSANNSSNPALLGFANIANSGAKTRLNMADVYAGLQSGNAEGLQVFAYWGIVLQGQTRDVAPSFAGAIATSHVYIPLNVDGTGVAVRATSGHTANLQEWQNNGGTAMASISAVGRIGLATGNAYSSAGTGTLVAGTATISTTAVTSSSLIFLTATANGAHTGTLSVLPGNITAGTSFVVNSSNVLDTNTFNWFFVN